MKQKLKDLYVKYGDILRYAIIGGLTTLIDLAVFAGLNSGLGLHYQIAKAISTVLAILFAFVGNKWVVFQSKERDLRVMLREAGSFFLMRFLTYLFSVAYLYFTISRWQWDENVANLTCNVVVIILNYIFSRFFVFRKQPQK